MHNGYAESSNSFYTNYTKSSCSEDTLKSCDYVLELFQHSRQAVGIGLKNMNIEINVGLFEPTLF